MKKQIYFLLLLFISVGALYSFVGNGTEKGYEVKANPQFSNLKVLPKDISEDDLMHVMHNFNSSLGVKCTFCHEAGADGKLDFPSDGNKHKNKAREMMKMTMGINKKYFKTKDPQAFKVTCYTCHSGKPHPEKVSPMPEEPKG